MGWEIAILINDPAFPVDPSTEYVTAVLEKLQRDSDTFIDIGVFNERGIQAAYAGPVPALERRDYSGEEWYQALLCRYGDRLKSGYLVENGFISEKGMAKLVNGGIRIRGAFDMSYRMVSLELWCQHFSAMAERAKTGT